MLAAEDLPIPGILGHLVSLGSVHANVRTFLAPWRAVQAAAGVFLVAAVVFVLFLKKVGDSNMDSLFKFIFRLQATQSLVNSAFILAGLIISAVNSTDGPARVLLCRLVASAGISLNVGFVFSMLVVALIRVAYIFFPIYIHSLPTAVLQVAISTGWLVVVAGFFAALYEEEVWSVQGLYYCLGLNADDIDHPMMLTVIFPVMNALTVLAYVFILVQQFTRKIPRRRHQVGGCDVRGKSLGGAGKKARGACHKLFVLSYFIYSHIYLIIQLQRLPVGGRDVPTRTSVCLAVVFNYQDYFMF